MTSIDPPASPATRAPGDLWISAVLLGAQSILYLVYPGLEHAWEYWAMSGSATLFLAVLLWETRHQVRARAMHAIHVLILIDTQAEGVLQYWVDKPARLNLYCVAGFALVIALYRLAARPAPR